MTEEKFGQVLAVCANADFADNLKNTTKIIGFLLNRKYISDQEVYEFTSVNPDKPQNTIVYDKHIVGFFGAKDFPELQTEYYDVVIFQNCMTCAPYTGEASIYNLPMTIQTLSNILKKNGIFISSKDCYYDGDGNDVRNKILSIFNHIGMIGSKLEIWEKL